MRIWRWKGLRNLHKLTASRARQRARPQTHNWFLLKVDVILENRGGLGFSKEDGAAITALDSRPCIQPNTVDCQALMGETCWYSLFLLHYFWIIFRVKSPPRGIWSFPMLVQVWRGIPLLEKCLLPNASQAFTHTGITPGELIKTQVLSVDWDPEILHF